MPQLSRYYTYIEPAVKNPKSQAYTMMILSLFSIAFFGIFAIRPTILTIISLQKEIEQANETNEKLSQKINALTKADDVLNRLSGKEFLLKEALPQTPNVALILRFLETTAQDTRITIQNLQIKTLVLPGEEARGPQTQALVLAAQVIAQTKDIVEEPVTTAAQASTSAAPIALSEVRFSFSLNGDLQGIQDYLKRLATKRRLIVVDSIRLSKNEKNDGYTTEVSAKAYVTPSTGTK